MTVSDTATIAGNLDLSSLVSSNYTAGDSFDLLHAGGGITGRFATVDTSSMSLADGLKWDVVYQETNGEVTDVLLKVVRAIAPATTILGPVFTTAGTASTGFVLSANAYAAADPGWSGTGATAEC